MNITETDISFLERAIILANDAEQQGNLPVGAVICYEGAIIAEGQNTIWQPTYTPTRHAEIEALRNVPRALWVHSRAFTLYTTLEPCLMCLGAILLHRIGRVIFGAADSFGGASTVFGHMPTFFEEQIARIEWIGPAYAEKCDPLHEHLLLIERPNEIRRADA